MSADPSTMEEKPELPQPAFAGRGAVPAAPNQVNILVVDDREDKRMAIEAVLADLGQNLVSASSGREALRRLLHEEFAVILLDVNMPGMDGFETANLIRQRQSSEHVPIIFVTAISDTETHLSRGYSLGAVDYLMTPVMPEVLRAKVSVFVELSKKTAEVKRQAEALLRAHNELEVRVKQRTTELAVANKLLQAEIAERQRAEEEIRKWNGELEQRVRERTEELVAANRELETFTYSIAHDLRAPLRHIHGYAQILDEEFASLLPPEAREYVIRIGEKGKGMGQMVDDLLALSDIAKRSFDRQPTAMTPLVEEVVAGIKADLKDRDIEWKIGELPTLSCNRGLMRQVFMNLLSNAVKYTRPRDPATIEIGQVAVEGGNAIYIRDNGVGFDMQYVGQLFGVFQRLHSDEEFEGTGVGLAIVARIIQRHGGRIWAEAALNEGATFHFVLG